MPASISRVKMERQSRQVGNMCAVCDHADLDSHAGGWAKARVIGPR